MKSNKIYILLLIIVFIFSYIMIKTPMYSNLLNIDNKVIYLMSKIRTDRLNILFKIITEFGNVYIPFIIIFVLAIFLKNKKIVIMQLSSYIISGTLALMTKYMYMRERPTIAVVKIPTSYSFPSGHTLTSFIFYMILCYLLTRNKPRKVKVLYYSMSILLIIFIGISRIYLGVHYFSDVIGGFIYGIILFFILKNTIEIAFKEKII